MQNESATCHSEAPVALDKSRAPGSLLQEAISCVQDVLPENEAAFAEVAQNWSNYLGMEIDELQVCEMEIMAALVDAKRGYDRATYLRIAVLADHAATTFGKCRKKKAA